MCSTTLVTFLLQTPPSTRVVELLGSWDNFSHPYRLEKDLRLGRGHWRGCHTFKDIICDGDINRSVQRRNGGLKIGGTYWYFFRLDEDEEIFNKAEPSTTLCPFLPGQEVNLLEVPTESQESKDCNTNAPDCSTNSDAFTLDPQHKYLPLKPLCLKLAVQDSKSKPYKLAPARSHTRSSSRVEYQAKLVDDSSQLNFHKSQSASEAFSEDGVSSTSRSSRLSSLMALFHRIRGTRSVEHRYEKDRAALLSVSRGESSSAIARRQNSPQRFSDYSGATRSKAAYRISPDGRITSLAKFALASKAKQPMKCSTEGGTCFPPQSQVPEVPPNTPMKRNDQVSRLCSASRQRELLSGNGPASADMATWRPESHIPNRIKKISTIDKNSSDSLSESSMYNGLDSSECFSENELPYWDDFDQQHRLFDNGLEHRDVVVEDSKNVYPRSQRNTNEVAISTRTAAWCDSFSRGCILHYGLPLAESTFASKTELPQMPILQPLGPSSAFLHNHLYPDCVRVGSNESKYHLASTDQLIDDLGYLGVAIV